MSMSSSVTCAHACILCLVCGETNEDSRAHSFQLGIFECAYCCCAWASALGFHRVELSCLCILFQDKKMQTASFWRCLLKSGTNSHLSSALILTGQGREGKNFQRLRMYWTLSSYLFSMTLVYICVKWWCYWLSDTSVCSGRDGGPHKQ